MSNEANTLDALKIVLRRCEKALRKASNTILNEGVSKYPIFVVHQEPVSMGILLLDEDKWSFSASTLEEFVAKNLIESSKVEEFKKIYKPPGQFLCLFVVEGKRANFVFAPFLPTN